MAQPVDKYGWQHAILSEHGPDSPHLRLVLVAISLHMNASGTGAWPSQSLIAKRAGVGLRSVKRHVEAAQRTGWLMRSRTRIEGRKWLGTAYEASVPESVYMNLPERPWESDPSWSRGASVAPKSSASVAPVEPEPTRIECQPRQELVPTETPTGANDDIQLVPSFGPLIIRGTNPRNYPEEGALSRTPGEIRKARAQNPEALPIATTLPVGRGPRGLAKQEAEPERFSKAQAAARDFGITEPDRLARMFQLTPERALEAIA